MDDNYVHYDLVDEEGVQYVEYKDGGGGRGLQQLQQPPLRPTKPFNVKGRTYLRNSMLAEAVKAVIRGKMNVNKASNIFNVPRSSLQRKVAQSREEHKRSGDKEYVERLAAAKEKIQRAGGEEEDEARRAWKDEYSKMLDQVEEASGAAARGRETSTSVQLDESAMIRDQGETSSDYTFVQIAKECIIEEDVDPAVDNHIYLERYEEEWRQEGDEESEIPPPPQIGIEIGRLEMLEEEDVVVDSIEEIAVESNIEGMPQLDSIYEF